MLAPTRRGTLPVLRGRAASTIAMLGVGSGPGALLLRLLVALDLALIAIHIVKRAAGDPGSYFLITSDRGYGELTQYGKMFWVALLLVALWRVWRAPFFLFAAAAAWYALADDALRLHERLHRHIPITLPAEHAALQSHVQEALYMLTVGLLLLVPLVVTYLHTGAQARPAARAIVALFLVIAFFAVVVDLVHMASDAVWYFETMAVVEDGGEMLATSVLVAFLFGTVLKTMTDSPVSSPARGDSASALAADRQIVQTTYAEHLVRL